MKTLITILLLQLFALPAFADGNITVNATSGSSGTTYTTLKAAIDAINAGTHKGDVTILVNANTTESSAMTLNYSGSGSANYSSILLYPTAAGVVISGSISGNMIALNGADNITFDGRVNQAGAADLTITNTSTGSGSSTFYFYGDAQNNTLRYCYIKGSSTNTSGGVIYFGTGTTAGNDNNLIDNCYIREIGSNKPRFLVYSAGTSAKENSNNTISNCSIFCFGGGSTNAGIYLYSNSTAWTINGNSFYQDDIISGSTATSYGININTGSGHTVTGNFVGGSAPMCGGTPWTVSGTPVYCNLYAIYLNVGTTSATSVQGNTIKNISWQSTNTGTHWIGIYISAGNVNAGTITGNTIGESTGNGSITIYNGANYGNAIGIYSTSTGTVNIYNNNIGSFTFSTSSYSSGFTGIKVTPSSSAGTTTVSGNLIGSLSTANSINMNTGASSGSQSVMGIMGYGFSSAGALVISSNTIANMYNNSASATDAGSSLMGMFITNAGTCTISGNTIRDLSNLSKYTAGNNYGTIGIQLDDGQLFTVTRNTIYNLANNNTGAYNTGVVGIYNCATGAGGASQFSKNRIYNLTNLSTGSGPYIYGINCLYSGAADYINNEITLGAGVTGGKNILGVMLYDSGPVKFYYNSIYISGTATSCNSIAFQRYIWTASYTTQIKNNIFYNSRSGGTGTHYAIASTNSTPTVGMSAGYSNYNLFITPNSNIAALWYYTNNSFSTWKSNSSCDAGSWYVVSSSINASDLFTDAANGNLTVNRDNAASWYVSGKGMPLTGYCDDFDSTGCRSTTVISGATDIGSCEFQTAVEPVNAVAGGTHAVNGTETFTFSGRTLCSITWGASGTLPVINYVKYHIGKNPTCTEGSYSNGYWEINTTGGSGFSYSITLYYDANMLGTISSESNIRIAKSEDNQNWIHFEGASVNTTAKTVNVSGLTSFSYFALSDQSSPMPVSMNYFRAAVTNNNVTLQWQTSAEIDNAGFDIERKSTDPVHSSWQKAGYVKGTGNSTAPVDYTFEDLRLPSGSYTYRLKQIDNNGNYEYFELGEAVTVTPPGSFSLSQNYPNPSNPNSKIEYLLPAGGVVSIRVYDITGKEVSILVNEYKEAGYHTAVFDGTSLASGVYYYSITAGEYRETKKMILLK